MVGSCVQGQPMTNYTNINGSFQYLHAGLTIGAERSFYSIREDEGSLEICIDVLQGTFPSSESYDISYTTASSDAKGV